MKTDTEYKTPKLLVDNLTHLHDWGLAVEFTDSKLKEMVNRLKKDGYTRLEAGQSHLEIRTVGRVTFTHLYRAHGSYHTRNAHYLDEPSGLKYTLKGGDDSEDCARKTLKAVILGKEMPYIWNCKSGDAQDKFRQWFTKWGWTLGGEAGMRAMAVEEKKKNLDASARTAKGQVEYDTRQKAIFDRRDFDAEIASSKETLKKALVYNREDEAKIRALMEEAEKPEPDLKAIQRLGISYTTKYDYNKGYIYTYLIPGQPAQWSHPLTRPNYTATREGNEIILSSGIKCEVTVEQALAWMRGEGPAPYTTYGTCTMQEVADFEGNPWKAVKCGCHVLDLRGLGDDFAEALKPTHVVTQTQAATEILWDKDPDGCRAFMKRRGEELLEQSARNRSELVARFATNKRELLDLKNNKEAKLLEFDERIEKDEVAQFEAEKNLEDFMKTVATGTLETLMKNLKMSVNALAGIRMSE